ncbi:hypothetical protein EUA06_21475 [Nocardioides glacieisoli]|uniref:Uncharacterized protein n=1 Tax=Nocardioides glacieisoli TaxID=1168730 RepID=A0A4Q2RL76_9ACTN|nr:hypothetical protein [Nocardioides glacieisoli]RYB88329.1 hypothetical protein EUA06_21475 [Nocardioides glacieisoli]
MTDTQPPEPDNEDTPAEPSRVPAPRAPSASPVRWRARAGHGLIRLFRVPPDRVDSKGARWPSTKEQFIWDLLPDELAPNKDGIIEPKFSDKLKWTEDVADDDVLDMYRTSREYRQAADDTTRNLELKAARLATVLVALLTANAALVVYEITRLGHDPSAWRWGLVASSALLGLASAGWLVVGLTRAVDADQRMGITSRSSIEHVAHDERVAMVSEVHGYYVSDWTRRNKADRLLNARAAVSRSMVCLISSAVFALALTVHTTLADEPTTPPSETTFTPPPTPTPSTTPTPTPSPSRAPSTRPTKKPKPKVRLSSTP